MSFNSNKNCALKFCPILLTLHRIKSSKCVTQIFVFFQKPKRNSLILWQKKYRSYYVC